MKLALMALAPMVLAPLVLALWPALALAHPNDEMPRTHATPYSIDIKVAYRGQTIEKCTVDLKVDGTATGHAVTHLDGLARFEGLTSERFELTIQREGYFASHVTVYNFARNDLHEDISLKKRVRWSLSGTVRGRGALIHDARVKLASGADQPAETTTAATGTFSFPALYDTECQLFVEAPGFHRHSLWNANREQKDLIVDVDMFPRSSPAGTPWIRGEPEPPLELRFLNAPPHRIAAEDGPSAVAEQHRILPADDRPAGALTGARLDLPSTGRPAPSLVRAARLLDRLIQPYPKPFRPSRKRR